MRIGCLQFAPQVGDVDNNLNRADAVLSKSQDLGDLDLLVLPELAFTGYNFHSLAHVTPFLEHSGSGISSLWARTTALKLNCNVVVGYPEKVDVADKWPTSPEFYNSAIMVNRDGETIANYRKSFLYAVDETWALEGRDGFFEAEIPDLGNVAMGICMDINPYKFEAPWHAFEFSFHVLEMQANLVILTMAWATRENPRAFTQLPQEPDLKTLEYWVQRLEPVIRSGNQEEIIFVICNRTGVEEDCVYTGTSTVFGVLDGEVSLYGYLGRGVKQVLVVDTDRKPFAKIVRDAPDGEGVGAGDEGQYPPAPSSHRTPEKNARSVPSVSAPPKSGNSSPQQVTSPGGSNASEKSTASGNASMPSVPSTKPVTRPKSTKPAQPKLGLQIPDNGQTTSASRRWLSPASASKATTDEEKDLPTPTGPSPTPTSMRPKFPLPEYHSSLPPIQDCIPSYVHNLAGMRQQKRMDSPITPPTKSWIKMGKCGPPIVRGVLPSPPVDEMFPPQDSIPARVGTSTTTVPAVSTSAAEVAPLATPSRNAVSERKQTADVDKKAEEVAKNTSPDSQLKKLSDAMKELQELSDAQNSPNYHYSPVLPHPSTLPDMASEIRRPESTKSRNASCSRAESAQSIHEHARRSSLSRMSIPIMASPSVFHRDGQNPVFSENSILFRPGSSLDGPSTPAGQGREAVPEARNASVPRSFIGTERTSEPTHRRALSRPVSRGRQPLSKNSPTNGHANGIVSNTQPANATRTPNHNATRSFSESTDRGRQMSLGRSVVSRGATSTASSVSWLFGTPPPKTEPALDPDDEIVAMINLINHSCPVHNGTHTHEHDQQSPSHGSPNEEHGPPTAQGTPAALDEVYEVILPPNIRELVESLSSPEPHGQSALLGRDFLKTSPKFEPPTPRAMEYDASLKDEAVMPAVATAQAKQEC